MRRSAQRIEYASLSDRLLGQVLDAVIGFAPVLLATFVFRATSTFYWIAFAWMLWYYFFADGLVGGQSFGKRAATIRVISEATGEPCTFGQSFARNLLLYLLGPIDWIFIVGEKHQRLGDRLAGTVVIQAI